MVRGWLHEPEGSPRAKMALFHGAGSNANAPLMVAVAEEFSRAGWLVFRGDLPYRQERASGPPRGNGAGDREGIRRAVEELRQILPDVPLALGGHSYGGRQCSMVAAEDAAMADVLLLLSYPLHPPGDAEKPRTGHFTQLRTPALFVHGTRDPFGSVAEMEAALKLIPARTKLEVIEGAPHGVPPKAAASLPPLLWAIMKKNA